MQTSSFLKDAQGGTGVLGALRGKWLEHHRGLLAAVGGLVLAALAVQFATGINFFKITNLLNVARAFSTLGIAGIGQTIVIVGGGLDLSVAEVVSTSNVMAATFMNGQNYLFLPVTVLTLVFGAAVGLVNGTLVAKRNVPPFVATLGTSIVLRGSRLMWTQGLPQGHVPMNLKALGTGATLGVPNLFYVFLAFAVAMAVVLSHTGYGRRLYAVGTNRRVAILTGIRSDRVVVLSYVICAASAALVGVLLGGYTGMSDQKIGEGYELDSIAVSVLGGAAIGGGSGGVGGTVLGAVIILVLTNLSLLMGFPIQSQMVIKGAVIVLALWINAQRGEVKRADLNPAARRRWNTEEKKKMDLQLIDSVDPLARDPGCLGLRAREAPSGRPQEGRHRHRLQQCRHGRLLEAVPGGQLQRRGGQAPGDQAGPTSPKPTRSPRSSWPTSTTSWSRRSTS